MPKNLLCCLLAIVGSLGLARAQTSLSGDMAFFERKADTYQRWLQKRHIGNLLSVREVRLGPGETTVELLLELRSDRTDHAIAKWEALQRHYQPVPGTPTIQHSLFRALCRYLEVTPDQATLLILPELALARRDPVAACFQVRIDQPSVALRTYNRVNDCKSALLKIDLEFPTICTENVRTSALHTPGTPEWVFENVRDFASRKYLLEKEHCEERYPELVAVRQTNNYLEFYVTDLCQEVLTAETKSFWCRLVQQFGGSCNDTRRERLEFRVHLAQSSAESFQLAIELTGKFGSGLYRPRESNWLDMDPDFEDDFLVPHARKFESELIAYLTRP